MVIFVNHTLPLSSVVYWKKFISQLFVFRFSLQKNQQLYRKHVKVSIRLYCFFHFCTLPSQPKASGWMVVLGSLKLNGINPFEVTLSVTNITMSNLKGDNIALLQLGTKPTLSNYIQPICLDTSNTDVTLGSTCWVAGWDAGQGGM